MAKNIILLLVRRGLGAVISMLCTTIIIKNLTIGNYGIYAVFLNVVAMVSTFGTLGIDSASSFVLQNNKYEHKKVLINIFFCTSIMLFLTAVVSGLLFFNLQTTDLNLIPHHLKIYLVICTVSVLLCNILFAVMIGNMDFKDYAVYTMIPNVLLLLLLLIYKYTSGITLQNSVIFYTAGFLLSGIVVGISQFIKYGLHHKIREINQKVIRYIFDYGIRGYLSNVITFLNYRINIFIIGYYLGVNDVGLYSTCLVLMDFVWLIASTIASITYPLFSNPENIALRKKMLPIITRTVLLITLMISALFYLLGNTLIPILFGDAFLQIRTIFLIATPGIILMAGTKIISIDFTAQGKPQVNIYLNLLAFIVTVVANFLLIPTFGIKGAAFATTCAFTVLFLSNLLYYTRITNTNIFSYIIPEWSDLKLLIKAKA